MTKNLFRTCLLLALIPFALQAQTAHAGATIPIGSGFLAPAGVAVDGYGNVFVADPGTGRVYEIVAVNGAVSASSTVNVIGSGFSSPMGVAVDGSGNVFVADEQVKEIVAVNGAVSASSTVNVIADGMSAQGIALDRYGNVFVADGGQGLVYEFVAVNGAVTAGSTANVIGSGFASPSGVAVDGYGNVFVADPGIGRVYEIVSVNGVVSASSTVNAIGSGFTAPTGVAVDGYGNVFVSDEEGLNAALEIVAVNGAVSATSTVQVVGTGYLEPMGVAVHGSGNVFVANRGRKNVLETLSGAQKFPTTPVATTSAPLTVYFTFDTAGSLAANPYVVLTQGAQNLDFQPAATQPSNACTGGQAYNPGDICAVNVTFTPAKPFQRIGAVQLMGSSGTPIATFDLTGTGTGPQVLFPSNSAVTTLPSGSGFADPYGVAVDGSGNVYVAAPGKKNGYGGWNRISNCKTGTTCETGNSAGNSTGSPGLYQIAAATGMLNTIGQGFGTPAGVAVDGSGNVFVADPGNGAVYQVVAVNGVVSSTSTVNAIGSVNGNFATPTGVAVDGSGNVFVADPGNSAVYETLAVNGLVTANSVVNTIGNFSFNTPTGVALDISGDVFVADSGNNAVYEIVAAGGAVTANSAVQTIGVFTGPTGLALDGNGNLYVAAPSFANTLVEVLATNGIVSSSSTVVPLGSGFNAPAGVALDARGNIFIADTGNQLAKEIDRADPPSLTFLTTTPVGSADSTDGTKTVTVANNGNAMLNFPSSISFPAGFLDDSSSTCGGLNSAGLASGASCTLGIDFQPAAVGSNSGVVVLTDNNLNFPGTTQSIQVSGTGSQGTPLVSTPPTASSITYGQPLSASTLTGGVVSTPGAFSWTSPTTILNASLQTASVTFTPASTNYTAITLNVSITVNPATPNPTPPTAGTITYGQSLSASTLTGGAAPIPGSFAWTSPTTIPNAGIQTASVTFTPTSNNYTTVTLNVSITVNQATPTITTPPVASAITYGQPLSASTLTGGTASTPGTFAWTTGTTIPSAGTQTASITFTPTSTNYKPATSSISLIVNQATPSITTPPVAGAITYGQQLNASTLTGGAASTPGAFTWTTGTTIPNAGTQTASVTFTPASTNYKAVTVSISVTVLLSQTITFNPIPGQVVGGMLTVSASATSGLPVSFTIVQNGNCSLSGSTLTFLNPGNCGVVATQPGNSTYAAAAPVGQIIVVSAPTVTLGLSNTTQTYQTWTNFVIGPTFTGSRVPTGTVTLYLNGSALVTLKLGGNGLAYYTASPFNVGANVLYATYSGDSHFAAGRSASVTITVLPAPVNFQASCWGGIVYGVAYQCTVNVSASTTIQPGGVVTYSLDGAAATTVALVNSNTAFTVPTLPSAGSHTLVINYAAQGNYAAAAPITRTFTTAQVPTLLLISPSSFLLASGSALTISGTASTPTSGVPTGSVTIYDNGTAIGTASIGSNGAFSYKVASIAHGLHAYYARYLGATNYTAANSPLVVVTAY